MNAQTRPPLLHESRNRLAKVRVLLTERDTRTASLVHSVLFSFGFQTIKTITKMSDALDTLRNTPFDLIITEWALGEGAGIDLVQAIRRAKEEHVLRRDIPIIMLTAKADLESVNIARDAGITEFLVKPFTAATLSHRLIQVIDNPRGFVDAPGFVGPDRRRRENPNLDAERRARAEKAAAEGRPPPVEIALLPPNRELQKKIGEDLKAETVFSDQLIKAAQRNLENQETKFLDWAKEDVQQLEECYKQLYRKPNNAQFYKALMEAAYSIKSHAGIFGYHLGTEIAGNLVDYMEKHPQITPDGLTVLRKHIDTIAVIFNQKIKESTGIGHELLHSLQRLVSKFN